jgi:hypothetical protein
MFMHLFKGSRKTEYLLISTFQNSLSARSTQSNSKALQSLAPAGSSKFNYACV